MKWVGQMPNYKIFWAFCAALLAMGPLAAQSAHAQSRESEQRIRKLEQEVSALQRKVFPGDSGRYFEPEITAPNQPAPANAIDPSGGAVTDLLSRMDAVEAALQQLTSQVEVGTNAMRLLNARVDALEAAQAEAARIEADRTEPSAGIVDTPPARTERVTGIADTGRRPASPPQDTPADPVEEAPALVRPETGDAADDTYVYGFRLWDAGQYGEARAELNKVVERHAAHRRASWARNLIGRAYLDEGKPREAAEWFLKNYLANRDGERAPDSLVYLGIATLQLGNATKACEALEEFRQVYPGEAGGRLSNIADDTARRARCS